MLAYLKDRQFLHATALLVGTMVGVGIFGIPFVFAKAGFVVGLGWLVLLTAVTLAYNMAFAELTLQTAGTHQLPGYADRWLGPWARRVTFFALLLSGYGTLLAYMIIVGQFLQTLLSPIFPINPDWYSVLFALVWSLVILTRVRTVAAVELFMSVLFGVTILIVTLLGVPHMVLGNFSGLTPLYWFLPYGVILFALSGANAIPIQRQLLVGRERLLKPAILTAVLLVAVLYLVFAITVVGVSGELTTPDAVSGLLNLLGNGVLLLLLLFGVMAISTSFLMMATTLYETFRVDYGLRAGSSWLLVIAPPLLFFWGGLRNFIDVIGLVGSVAVGLLSVILLAAYTRSRNSRRWLAWILILFFLAGVVYSLVFR